MKREGILVLYFVFLIFISSFSFVSAVSDSVWGFPIECGNVPPESLIPGNCNGIGIHPSGGECTSLGVRTFCDTTEDMHTLCSRPDSSCTDLNLTLTCPDILSVYNLDYTWGF